MRTYQKRTVPNLRRKSAWEPVALETDKPLIIYPRQSTPKQKKDNIYSREMQTTDLIAYARELGWQGEVKSIKTVEDLDMLIESVAVWRESGCIIVLEIDLGVSGKLKIEKRKGMSCLVYLVGEGAAKTVMCQKEDRLFRDDTGLEYNTYIQVCLRYDVKTITEEYRYDFSIREHRKRFREKCDQAANFLEDYVRDRLQRGKLIASGEGKYCGGGIAPGFVPDRQKYLPNGEKNPNYGKLKPYEPWIPAYRWCFIRFRELGGNLFTLRKEIAKMPVLFPDFEEGVLTEGEQKLIPLTKVPGGYKVGIWGLKSLLTNVAAIGWYRDRYGLLVDEHGIPVKNHPPVIQEHEQDLFWYAFDRVSPIALDGTRIRPIPARFTRTPEESPALLKDIIASGEDGKGVHVHRTSEGIMYSTYIHVPLLSRIETMIDHREVDGVFVRQLFEHLKRTHDFEHYRDYVQKEVKNHEQKKTHIDIQLQGITDQIAGIEATLELPPSKLSKERREKYAEKLARLEARKLELESEKQLPASLARAQELMEYSELIHEIIEVWDKQTIEYRKSFIETFVAKLILAPHSPHWYTLTVYWRDPTWGVEEAVIWKQSGIGKKWTEAELNILREKYPTSTAEEMLQALPIRTWTTIRRTAHIHNLKREIKGRQPVSVSLAYADWQFMKEREISYGSISMYKDGVWSLQPCGTKVNLQ